MEEVTYEDWQKNPTSRMMWVWNDYEDYKAPRKVIYVLKANGCSHPVLAIANERIYETFKHCAEIVKQRRMTRKELSRWLREKTTREFKYWHASDVYSFYSYAERYADEEVDKRVMIREDDGEWREPLVEE